MSENATMSLDEERGMKHLAEPVAPNIAGHHLPMNDPDNPMNWPLQRKIFASTAAWLFTAVV
jgi:hypothetical protein